MQLLKKPRFLTGLLVFIITFIVFIFSVERTGSLWDCGEFILGAYKMEVVHPPGAALFMLIGRMFAGVASVVSDNPSDIAFGVNLMSGMLASFTAVFAAWITMIFGKLALVGRDAEVDQGGQYALMGAGLVAGLATAFSSSIWFSAVEGEVYAMSTCFTALTFWTASKWYEMDDNQDADRWLILSLFCGALSIGVHLLSLLTYPSIALLYYYKKYKTHSLTGVGLSLLAGVLAVGMLQKVIIVGIPTLWKNMELFTVNSLGLPFHSGIIPTIIIIFGVGYLLLRYANKKGYYAMHLFTIAALLSVIGFSTIGVIVVRANADTPVNMNVPSDAMRLLPYLNREQYGERALLKGPHYNASPIDYNVEERYGRVGDRYEIVDEKFEVKYNPRDMILFPRIGHNDQNRIALHNMWRRQLMSDTKGDPSMAYNLKFMLKYQMGWMYMRYFMWNFVGRQNGDQGYFPWDLRTGHWQSGVKFFDEAKLYNMDQLPDTMKNDESNNTYYFLPLIFGILGLVFHFFGDRKDFFVLLVLFAITGLGIIIYSNQPPNEPRERDYVLVGSFMTFCIWIGMGVLAIYDMLRQKLAEKPQLGAALATIIVLSAPVIMGFQNYDDHSRKGHYGSRDYASNFLNSVEENAIIFTYGDNDTYPLWYAQEVEGIRTDVRVVNLSLIQVDWYINKLRNKVNDSPPINLTMSPESIRGNLRNQITFPMPEMNIQERPMELSAALRTINDPRSMTQGGAFIPTRQFFIAVDSNKVVNNPLFDLPDDKSLDKYIPINFPKSKRSLIKDELAVMDIISSNFYDRPIYFAVTCEPSKLLGLNDNTQLEGLALRIVPWETPSDSELGIYGNGMVDVEKCYENIMTKWKWGNFDKFDTYINDSYNPEINAMKMAMIRTASKLIEKGDTQRAMEVANKNFEVFPHFNFAYDNATINFINILIRGKDFENAKKQMRILAEETRQWLDFYSSLDNDDLMSFESDMSSSLEAVRIISLLSQRVEDPAFAQEMNELLSAYNIQNMPN
ncbi:MAG: DUF2723 domain-containing protein [Saprospiraceae bacterium]|nr:DUF2723 domain-containing protein [Saprospiraceae bacterium]